VTALLLLLSFQIPPRPATVVADFANVLSASDKAALEQQLGGTRVVVATFRSLEGEEAQLLTTDIARKWGVGEKGKDDGVLIALYIDDHKWSIAVGYGAEPVLTDLQAHQVGVETLVPKLRAGDTAGALRDAGKRIQDILDRKAPPPLVRRRAPGLDPRLIALLLLIGLLGLGALARRRGTLGAGGFSSLPWWWWWFGGGGGGGWGGGGGGWGGGGGDGGGGGGGFGGGDFGGGGASGDW
jgi:uncharacterized protein